MADYTAYFRGEWVTPDELKINVKDRGFMSSDVVFDICRTFNGKTFQLSYHIDRLYRSLKYTRIDPGLSSEEMLDISEEVVRRNEPMRAQGSDFYVRQFVTRGPQQAVSTTGPGAATAGPPTVGVDIWPVDSGRFARVYTEGLHGVIARTRSYPVESMDSKIKHYSRMNFNLAELEVADVDPDAWPILMDSDGNLTEGTSNNVFLVTNGVLRTPSDRSILQGGSRKLVIDLAHQLSIPVVEEDLQPYDLYTADEAFFSRTGPCILPVTQADRRQIADGKPGPMTQQLMAAWSEAVGVDIAGQAEHLARQGG